MDDIRTCIHCDAPIIRKEDPTGQRGLAWAETDEDYSDWAFQCGLSPDNLHHPLVTHDTRIDEDEKARTYTASCACQEWTRTVPWGRSLPIPTTRDRAYSVILELCCIHNPR
jgi:hypothetical protein